MQEDMVRQFHWLHYAVLFCRTSYARSRVLLPESRWNSSISFILMCDGNPPELPVYLPAMKRFPNEQADWKKDWTGEKGGGWVVVFVVSSGGWVVGFMYLGQLWCDGPRDGLYRQTYGSPSSALLLFSLFFSFQPFICWLIYTKCTT
jgi:hypothetical protein